MPLTRVLYLLQVPLLFYACAFEGLTFRRSAHSHAVTCTAVQKHLEHHVVSVAVLQSVSERLAGQAESEVTGVVQQKPLKHIPLLQRATEPALEERLLKYGAQPKTAVAAGTDEDVA